MRKLSVVVLAVLVTLSLTGACARAAAPEPEPEPEPEPTIEGVWHAVEVTITNDEGTTTNPITQPNMTVFTAGHYAAATVFGQEPREVLPEEPTDEQLVAAWRPFNANAGTYAIDGTSINTRVIVAKSPNATANNNEGSSEFELDGDVLYRTFTNPNNGNTFLVRYERIE